MVLLAATATPARQASGGLGGFDPSSTLGWSVPLILIGPLVALVMMVSGVRTRRGAATLAQLGVLVSAVGVGLALWARWKQAGAYTASYQWINIPVAFTGPAQFQGFGIDESIRLDHLALAYLVVLLALMFLVMAWHRVAGRTEPGPVRFYSICLVLTLGAAGVLVAPDLAEVAGFWGLAAVATYLLLTQRWGTEVASRGGQVALWLPFLTDLCLVAGIAVLYSRYGQLTIDKLIPVLQTTPGAGPKALTLAGSLLVVGVAGRLGLFPFSFWTTASVEAPPAAHALAIGTWSLLPLYLLWRVLPIVSASGPHSAVRVAGILAGLGLLGPLLAFVGNDIRRAVALAGSGAAAVALLALATWPASAPAPAVAWLTLAAVPAVALGRCASLLAAGVFAAAMRTPDMALMGEGSRRLPLTSAGLLLSTVLLALALAAPLAVLGQKPGPALGGQVKWIATGGAALTALALARPYFAVAFGALRRRRAFEPERIREVPGAAAGTQILLTLLGGAAVALSFFFTAWVAFLFGTRQAPDVMRTSVLWLAGPAGLAAGALAYGLLRAPLVRVSGVLGEWADSAVALGTRLFERYLAAPALAAVGGFEAAGLVRGEGRLGLALVDIGRNLRRWGLEMPVLPLLFIVTVAVVVIAALAAPGLAR